MRRFVLSVVLAATAGMAIPQGLHAQSGIGGIIDFINRLSGPRMIGIGGSYFFTPAERLRARVGVAYLGDMGPDEALEPDDAAVRMFSIQPALEIGLGGPLALSVGASLHRFFGDADEGFWHYSIPAYLQLRHPISRGGDGTGLHLRAGLGAQYFPSFDPDDFAPIDTGVKTDGGEVTFAAYLGFDWVLR